MLISETDKGVIETTIKAATNEQLTKVSFVQEKNPSNIIPLTQVIVNDVLDAWKNNWSPYGNLNIWRRNYYPDVGKRTLSRDQIKSIIESAEKEANSRSLK